MAPQPTIYIVCSDRHRNGKTLLARVLVDYLLLEDRDPFVIDMAYPEATLRASFPGRTALVDFSQVQGQMKLFDTIVGSRGRTYVIDVPAPQTENFFDTMKKLGFHEEAARMGYRIVVLFVVDKEYASLNAADDIRTSIAPSPLFAVHNHFIGSVLDHQPYESTIEMPVLDRDIMKAIEDRRFSLRAFILGEDSNLPKQYHTKLRIFLHDFIVSLRNIEPAITMKRLAR